MVMQIRRTATANNPPSGLAQGQLAVEMASDPPKLWCGVPVALDPSGRILISPSGKAVAMGSSPPASPGPGDLWFDPVEGQLYIYFNDGTSSQWVVTINQGGGGGGSSGPQMGVTDGSNAAPGEVGEYIKQAISYYPMPDLSVSGGAGNSNADSLTINGPTLSAGDWQVSFITTIYHTVTGSPYYAGFDASILGADIAGNMGTSYVSLSPTGAWFPISLMGRLSLTVPTVFTITFERTINAGTSNGNLSTAPSGIMFQAWRVR